MMTIQEGHSRRLIQHDDSKETPKSIPTSSAGSSIGGGRSLSLPSYEQGGGTIDQRAVNPDNETTEAARAQQFAGTPTDTSSLTEYDT